MLRVEFWELLVRFFMMVSLILLNKRSLKIWKSIYSFCEKILLQVGASFAGNPVTKPTLPHFNACNVPAPQSNPVTFFFAILSKRGRFSNSALCISFRLFPIDGQRFSRSAFHFGFNVLIFYSVE